MYGDRVYLLGIPIPRVPGSINYYPAMRDIGAASTINGTVLASILIDALCQSTQKSIVDDYRLSVMADMTAKEMLWGKRNLLKNKCFYIKENREQEAEETCWLTDDESWAYAYHDAEWAANTELIAKLLEDWAAAQ